MEQLPSNTPVSLDTTQPPEDNSVSLPVADDNQPVAPEVAKGRASKAQQGLGDILKKKEVDMLQDFIAGNENQIRKQAATHIDFENQMKRYQAIQDMAKNGPIEKSKVDAVMNDPFYNTPTDPDTVIENAYATKALSTLSTAQSYLSTGNIMETAQQDMPKQVQSTMDDASDLLTKNQYLLKKQQDAEAKVQNQSWGSYLTDTALNFSQIYQEVLQRGLIGNPVSGIGIGSNLDQAHYTLYQMPLPQFKATVDAAMANLEGHNPQLAAQYAQSLRSQNTFDTVLGNAFSALAIPDVVGGVKVVGKLSGMFDNANRVRKAAKDIVEAASKDPDGKPATLAEGAGDIKEATAQKITQAITDAANGGGNPLDMARDTLLSSWYDDAKKFVSNPGTYLSRELLTRTADAISNAGEDLYNRLATMNRVERTPAILQDPDAIKTLMDQERVKYKGSANTFLDIEGPIREPVSGTYWWKSKLGNYDATLFPDVETAKGFADQIGLANPIIKGVDTDVVYVPEAALKNFGEVRQLPSGHTKFFDKDGIEILSSPEPKSGMIAYDKKTGKFSKTLTDEQAKVAQQGLGFYIERWTPMKEDGNMVRDLLIKNTKGEFIPDAVSSATTDTSKAIRSLLGWVRNSEDTLSFNESAQRKAATYAQSNIHRWAQDLAKDLEDIANGRIREDQVTGERLNRVMVYPKSWINRIKDREVAKQFERTIDYSRRALDEDGNPGAFFKNPADLQDFYQRNFQRDPSYLETKAYFNFVKLIEGDRMMREVSEFRYRARLGTEQHSISYIDKNTGDTIKSPFFDGITQQAFPGGDEQILVIHGNKAPTVERLSNINTKTLDAYKEAVKEGRAKAIMLYDRNQMPLSGWTDVAKDKLIRYVMVDNSETKPIEFNHVKRRGGGHFEWDYDYYLKQADVRKQNIGKGLEYAYVGDKTVMPIKNRKLGEDVVRLWNQAHEFIKNNEWDKVKPIAQKLGIKYDEFTSWYHPGRDANGNPTAPLLNAHEPIVVVNKNKKISEMGSDLQNRYRLPRKDGNGFTELFRDATKSGPENNFKVQYNQERNSSIQTKTINDIGSQDNPIYAHQPAEMVDPMTTMNRALNRVINSTFMDDYKIYTVEHWLREAAPYLNASEAELRSAPFAWFQKPEWRSAVKDSTAVMNLMSNRMKAQQFISQPSKFDTWVHGLTAQLSDSFYEKYGPEASRSLGQKAVSVVPLWMLQHVHDPVQFIRSVTFNFKLGLFAVPQFLVQAQTHSLIWALEPRHGTVGTYSMLLHGWGSFTTDEQILQKLDGYASKLNGFGSKWRPGEWLEARRELDKAGFAHVAGEYSNINNQLKTRFIANDFEKGLKIGQYPFRMGEQSTRITAWYTAFREFRDANPTTPIGNIERSKILQKADLLTVNMSRASNSALSHGIFSLSTQFLSYQIKLAELFLGKRIGATTTERNLARARILTAFTALYGLPNAIGVTGAPFSDNIREHFMDDLGYIPGEKWWSTMVNEGLPAWTMSMITGQLDNVGDRFGSQGFQNIKQALRGDVPFIIAMGGAGVSTGWNFTKSFSDPYYQWYNSWMRGDNADSRFTITGSDLLQPWKEISSVSSAAKLWAAIQTGKWISKNEQNITDVSPLHAALLAATGLSPQDQDTIFTQNQMVKGEQDAKKAALSGFIVDWRRGIQNRGDNETQSISYFKNAMARAITAGMDAREINTAIAVATKAAGSNAIDDSDYNLWAKGSELKKPQRLEQLRTKLKMKDQ